MWALVSFGDRSRRLDCLTWNWRHWWNLGVTRGSGWEFRTPIPPTPSNNSIDCDPLIQPSRWGVRFHCTASENARALLHSLCWGTWLGHAALTWVCIKFLKVDPFVCILFSLETVNQYTIYIQYIFSVTQEALGIEWKFNHTYTCKSKSNVCHRHVEWVLWVRILIGCRVAWHCLKLACRLTASPHNGMETGEGGVIDPWCLVPGWWYCVLIMNVKRNTSLKPLY